MLRFGGLFVTGIILARSGITNAQIGIYETLLLISGIASFFWVSGYLNTLLPAYQKQQSEPKKKAYLFTSFLFLLACSILISGGLLLFKGSITQLSTSNGQLPYYLVFLLYILLNNPTYLTEHIFLLKEKSKALIGYGVFIFLLYVCLVALPALATQKIEYAVYGLVAVAALKFLFTIGVLVKNASFKFEFGFLKKHLTIAIPLILTFAISGSAEYIDGFIIANKFDKAGLTLFRYGARELPFVLLLANALSTALIPKIANNLQAGIADIKKRSSNLIKWLMPVSCVMLIVSPYAFTMIFGNDFLESAYVFNFYVLLVISRLIFPQTILIGLEKTRINLISACIEIVINIGLSLWLVNIWGYVGVAFATVIAYSFDKLFLITYVKFKLNIGLNKYLNIKHWAIGSIAVVVCFFIGIYLIVVEGMGQLFDNIFSKL